jgi:hypothetical protein
MPLDPHRNIKNQRFEEYPSVTSQKNWLVFACSFSVFMVSAKEQLVSNPLRIGLLLWSLFHRISNGGPPSPH